MSQILSQNFDQVQNSDIFGNKNFDDDDLVSFKHDSKIINLYYSHLAKYSKYIRDSYLFSDVTSKFPQEIHKFQEEFQLSPESVEYFFQFLQENCNINQEYNLTYIDCIDLLKISKFLEVRKLLFKINEYISDQKSNIDFIVQMIQYEVETHKEGDYLSLEISHEMERMLTSKINDCLSNEKFKGLPIQILYRIISKSSPNSINSNKLFDIIMKSVNEFCVLFPFLDLQKLSEDRLDDLCEIYSNADERARQCFGYLKCNLTLIREMGKRKKNLEETNEEQRSKVNELESKISSLQRQFDESENQLSDSKALINDQRGKMAELETKVASLQKQFDESEKVNNRLQSQLDSSNDLNTKQQNRVRELESQLSRLQRRIDEIFLIKGQVYASVEKGIFISAEINLKCLSLDTFKSKFIISESGEKSLGIEAYEKGEQITSLHMKTPSYLVRPGTHFVRCIVFSGNGESNEIVSDPVTTSGGCATFGYEGEKAAKISLYKGKYKLEVWGAKGGDSTGVSSNSCSSDYNRKDRSSVPGGLGGYSCGVLNLKENETVYVYVGGEGLSSGSSDGSITKGGFPDGGGTKTGHCIGHSPTVLGTGGGSTSIRIGSDTDYARVIVAGG